MRIPNELSPVDPQEEIKALKEALGEKSLEIDKLKAKIEEKILLGEWQLCPKCCGHGMVFNANNITTSVGWQNCDICSGAKIIMRPIIPPAK